MSISAPAGLPLSVQVRFLIGRRVQLESTYVREAGDGSALETKPKP